MVIQCLGLVLQDQLVSHRVSQHNHNRWVWEVHSCITTMSILVDLQEDQKILAVCFTRCDDAVMSAL